MYGRDVGTAQAPILRCLVPADGLAYEGSVGVDSRLGEVCAVVDKVFAVALGGAVPVDDAGVVVLGADVANRLVIAVL